MLLLLLFLKDELLPAAAPRRDGEEVEAGEERCVYRLDGDGMIYLFLDIEAAAQHQCDGEVVHLIFYLGLKAGSVVVA